MEDQRFKPSRQNVLQRADEKLLAHSPWGTLGNKTRHTQRGGETKSEYTCSIYKYIGEGRCVWGFEPGSLHPLGFSDAVLWTQWWAGNRRRDADAGQERAERPEEADRKLPRSLSYRLLRRCSDLLSHWENIHTGWKTRHPGAEKYKFNSGGNKWAGSVGRMCGPVWSQREFGPCREKQRPLWSLNQLNQSCKVTAGSPEADNNLMSMKRSGVWSSPAVFHICSSKNTDSKSSVRSDNFKVADEHISRFS